MKIKPVLFLVLASYSRAAQCQTPGGLVLTPPKILIDSKHRSGSCAFQNNDRVAHTYRIRLVDLVMTSSGDLKPSDKAYPYSIIAFARHTPRQIALAPGESQTLRVLVTRPEGLAAGEYRSHIQFETLDTASSPASSIDSTDDISFKLRLKTVITIPVIVESGSQSASASFTNVKLAKDDQGWYVSCRIGHAGNSALRGEVAIVDRQSHKTLGSIRSIAIYREVDSMDRTIRLMATATDLANAKLFLEFKGQHCAPVSQPIANPGS